MFGFFEVGAGGEVDRGRLFAFVCGHDMVSLAATSLVGAFVPSMLVFGWLLASPMAWKYDLMLPSRGDDRIVSASEF
jgi:hypothetical protein